MATSLSILGLFVCLANILSFLLLQLVTLFLDLRDNNDS
jgi:hypothetical protein